MAIPEDTEWYLLSLRPAGAHAGLRAAVKRVGGRLLALSPWRIERTRDPTTQRALQAALAAASTLFTSPAAVRATQALDPGFAARMGCVIAVGEGTARVLRRQGVPDVVVPQRMDSEGVLALPQLAAVDQVIGLITAPGGRGAIPAALHARGARIRRADVYRRIPLALSAQSRARLATVVDHSVLAVSSAEALQQLLPQLSATVLDSLRQRPVVAASDRLVAFVRANGFVRVDRAEGPLPTQLAAAAAATAAMTRRIPH